MIATGVAKEIASVTGASVLVNLAVATNIVMSWRKWDAVSTQTARVIAIASGAFAWAPLIAIHAIPRRQIMDARSTVIARVIATARTSFAWAILIASMIFAISRSNMDAVATITAGVIVRAMAMSSITR